jgi:glycosyltransferase involved in cell wall biosynthesis
MGEVPDSKDLVFLTYFPPCENMHLTKDIGMIPFVLHRSFSYKAYMLTYKNGEYPYLHSETPGLRICYLDDRRFAGTNQPQHHRTRGTYPRSLFRRVIDSWRFLSKYGKNIDILQLFHYTWESLIVASLFRFYNPRGVIYLKPDVDNRLIRFYRLNMQKLKRRAILEHLVLNLVSLDMITVETEVAFTFLRTEHPLFKRFQDRIHYIPNGGVDIGNPAIALLLRQPSVREDSILHIGRLGEVQKGTEVALEAFARVAPSFPNWKLVLVGPMAEPFRRYFADFLASHQDIRDQIHYKGYLPSREDVLREYAKSKILLQPSTHEGFANVVIESGIFGTPLVGSDIGSFRELTNGGAYGFLCSVGDIDCFSRTLQKILAHPELLDEMSAGFKVYVQKKYNWEDICRELHGLLISCVQKRRALTSG